MLAAAAVGLLAVALRVVRLDSDAYRSLCWSSGLLTDEGFYIHNARNLALFGKQCTDQFNNALIMPVLHAVQVVVFRMAGVGAVQARSISVVAGLLTVILLVDALRRAFDVRVAAVAGLVMALDHVALLYSRMALMDTPAVCVLTAAFWAFVRSLPDDQAAARRFSRGWLFAAGILLGVSYGVRGLCALVAVAPFAALRSRKRDEWLPMFAGLALALAAYGLVWWLPNAVELRRLNAYYLGHQVLPHSLGGLWHNVRTAVFGNDRGLSPYMWRHTPAVWGLGLLWLLGGHRAQLPPRERCAADFMTAWFVVLIALFSVISYSPSRYYVLFYPALASIAGLAVAHSERVLATVAGSRQRRGLLTGYLAYHVLEVVFARAGLPLGAGLWGLSALCGGLCALKSPRFAQSPDEGSSRRRADVLSRRFAAACGLLWLIWNGCWTADWLLQMSFRQERADRWLAEHLPANSVLLGDVAPGLCMNNRFVAVSVIPRLCNGDRPVERFEGRPRFIAILDGRWKEPYWRLHYPQLVANERRIHLFPRLERFPVGVYSALETVHP